MDEGIDSRQFRLLMQGIASAWNAGNARQAASDLIWDDFVGRNDF